MSEAGLSVLLRDSSYVHLRRSDGLSSNGRLYVERTTVVHRAACACGITAVMARSVKLRRQRDVFTSIPDCGDLSEGNIDAPETYAPSELGS